MKNKYKAINPMNGQIIHEGEISTEYQSEFSLVQLSGLTKLEYASIQAMNGMLSNYELIQDIKISNPEYKDLPFHEGIAKASIKIAEELLKQLENNKL